MKRFIKLSSVLILACLVSSCATIFGGKVTSYQRTTPGNGAPERKVRVVALIADIVLFWPSTIVDFATGAIYKPEGK